MVTNNCRLVSFLHRPMRMLIVVAFCLLLPSPTQATEFSVPGISGRNWFDTGLNIAPGTLLQLSAEGRVTVGPGLGSYGPEGTPQMAEPSGYPAETRNRYGLVARLTPGSHNPGDRRFENDLFEQWSYGETAGNRHCAASGGHLWLTVNDNDPGDNTGAFTVNVSLSTCPSEAAIARTRVILFTADNQFYRPTRRFRVGDTVVLKIENNTPASIFLRQAINHSRLIREEGLQIERAIGSSYVSVLPSGRSEPDEVRTDDGEGTGTVTYIDYALTQLIELRSTMNITRRWIVSTPGNYRLTLDYYSSRNTQRPLPIIYSATFDVQ